MYDVEKPDHLPICHAIFPMMLNLIGESLYKEIIQKTSKGENPAETPEEDLLLHCLLAFWIQTFVIFTLEVKPTIERLFPWNY